MDTVVLWTGAGLCFVLMSLSVLTILFSIGFTSCVIFVLLLEGFGGVSRNPLYWRIPTIGCIAIVIGVGAFWGFNDLSARLTNVPIVGGR